MKTHHVIGPPGTGKTSYLMGHRGAEGAWHSGQVARAAEKFGADAVMVCSLTKAAAREIASRECNLDNRMVGTLHSICFRSVPGSRIITGKQVEEFNRAFPRWNLTAKEVVSSHGSGEDFQASKSVFARYDLERARMTPKESWPVDLRQFDADWNDFKQQVHCLDFTDLIEIPLLGFDELPRWPKAIFADEYQDFSRLEITLLRHWASKACESLVLVGDPLQALFGWRGADPEAFLGECDFRKVLSQSFRVPKGPHAAACAMVSGLPGSGDEYLPKDLDGSVSYVASTYKHPDLAVETMVELTDEGQSAMVLASCAYMLDPFLAILRREGVPYHNPYSPDRWNPLNPSKGLCKRLLAFIRPRMEGRARWRPEEMLEWAPALRSELLERGAKKRMKEEEGIDPFFLMSYEAREAALEMDPWWLLAHSTKQHRNAYIEAVLKRLGPERFYRELTTEPHRRAWITIGTIHSVKGGEADHVLVFPDLSAQGYWTKMQLGWMGGESLRRLFYVAYTRTRGSLYVAHSVNRSLSMP